MLILFSGIISLFNAPTLLKNSYIHGQDEFYWEIDIVKEQKENLSKVW